MARPSFTEFLEQEQKRPSFTEFLEKESNPLAGVEQIRPGLEPTVQTEQTPFSPVGEVKRQSPTYSERTEQAMSAVDKFFGVGKSPFDNTPVTPEQQRFEQQAPLTQVASTAGRGLARAGIGAVSFVPTLAEKLISGEAPPQKSVGDMNQLEAFISQMPAPVQTAVGEVGNLAKMVADVPAQMDFIVRRALGQGITDPKQAIDPNNPLVKAYEGMTGKKFEDYYREAVNTLYQAPESLPFGLAIGKSALNPLSKRLGAETVAEQAKTAEPAFVFNPERVQKPKPTVKAEKPVKPTEKPAPVEDFSRVDKPVVEPVEPKADIKPVVDKPVEPVSTDKPSAPKVNKEPVVDKVEPKAKVVEDTNKSLYDVIYNEFKPVIDQRKQHDNVKYMADDLQRDIGKGKSKEEFIKIAYDRMGDSGLHAGDSYFNETMKPLLEKYYDSYKTPTKTVEPQVSPPKPSAPKVDKVKPSKQPYEMTFEEFASQIDLIENGARPFASAENISKREARTKELQRLTQKKWNEADKLKAEGNIEGSKKAVLEAQLADAEIQAIEFETRYYVIQGDKGLQKLAYDKWKKVEKLKNRLAEATNDLKPSKVEPLITDKPVKPQVSTGKQPWEMTQAEFERSTAIDTYGDWYTTPDGKFGKMRGSGGMGSDRVKLYDVNGKFINYYSKGELKVVRKENVELTSEKRADQYLEDISTKVKKLRDDNKSLLSQSGIYERFKKGIEDGDITKEKFIEKQKDGTLMSDADYAKAVEVKNQIDDIRNSPLPDITNVEHKGVIQQALSEGKPVPAEVLADYPDLAKKYGGESGKVTPSKAEPLKPSKDIEQDPPVLKDKPVSVNKPPKPPEKPVELAESPENKVIGLNKAEINKTIEEYGLKDLDPVERKKVVKSFGEAKKNNLSESALELADELEKSPKPISDAQHTGMVIKRKQLGEEYSKSLEKVESLIDKGDLEGANLERARSESILNNIDKLIRANDNAGTEIARALNIRKYGIEENTDNIASTVRMAKVAKQKPLKQKEEAKFQKLGKELEVTAKKVEELTQKWQEQLAKTEQLESELAFKANKKKAITDKAAKSKNKIQSERQEILKDLNKLGFRLNDVTGVTAEGSYLIGKLAYNYIKEGAVTMSEVVQKVLADLPEITERDVWRALIARDPNRAAKKASIVQKNKNRLKTHADLLVKIDKATDNIFSESKKRPQSPQEIQTLRNTLKEIRYNAFKTNIEGAKLEKLIQRIDSLQEMLANGQRIIKERKKLEPEAIQKARNDIKDLVRSMTVQDEIADLTKQLETGEFKVKEPPKRRKKPEWLEKEEVKLKQIRRNVNIEIERLAPMTFSRVIDEMVNTVRTAKATADISGTGRQGFVLTAFDPIAGAKAQKKALIAAKSEFKADLYDKQLRESPLQFERDRAKLFFSELDGGMRKGEEQFMSNWIKRVPYYKNVVEGSERHMITLLNQIRAEVFDKFIADNPNATLLEKQQWADFVNKASGRGDLGSFTSAANKLSLGLFAPRFSVSRFQVLNEAINPVRVYNEIKYNPRVFKLKARALASTGIAGMSILTLAQLSGYDVGTDPRSSDFGKIRDGDTRYDIWAGFQQPMRLLTRIGIAATDRAGFTGKELTELEKEFDLLSTIGNFIGYKTSPFFTTPQMILSGKDFGGDEITPSEMALRSITPIIVETMIEAYQQEGLGSAVKVGASEFVGFGANTYPDSQRTVRIKIRSLRRQGRFAEASKMQIDWNSRNIFDQIVSVNTVEKSDFDRAVNKIKKQAFEDDILNSKEKQDEYKAKLEKLKNKYPEFVTPTIEEILKDLEEKRVKSGQTNIKIEEEAKEREVNGN